MKRRDKIRDIDASLIKAKLITASRNLGNLWRGKKKQRGGNKGRSLRRIANESREQ